MALGRQGARRVSAIPLPEWLCSHKQPGSAVFFFPWANILPGTAELCFWGCCSAASSEVSCCGSVRCCWRSLAGTANSLLLVCQSLISHYKASRKPSQCSACHLQDSPRIASGNGLCWIFFSSVFMNFFGLAWLCPVPILCLPQGAVKCSNLLASYFLNTCANSFQGAVPLICSSKWKRIAAAALTANWRELKESEIATNWRVRKIWLSLAWKISHNTQQTLLNQAFKYANASVAACLMELFCEHISPWQKHCRATFSQF